MRRLNCKQGLISIGIILLFLAACGPTEEQMNATKTQIALGIFQTQTAAVTPTHTPTITPTFTSIPTDTPTNTPTPTEEPCSHVDLNGHYVDFRTIGWVMYGYIMDAEQHGCEFTATELFFLKASGPGSAGYAEKLTGTITDDKVRVCYVTDNYCLNLVIFDRGKKLVNGIEGWQYEKTED
jgi:hypothetical protein